MCKRRGIHHAGNTHSCHGHHKPEPVKQHWIRRLIEADGRRLALIVNEFGDVGVDGDVLALPAAARTVLKKISSNWPMAVSAARSPMIFCRRSSRCWHRRHRITLLLKLRPALLQPLVQAFFMADIRSRVMLDGVVTVVDGAALAAGEVVADADALEAQRQADLELDHGETPVDELFHDQVAAPICLLSQI